MTESNNDASVLEVLCANAVMDVNDKTTVLEILDAAGIDQLDDRTLVDHRGYVVRLRLNPCIGLQELPCCIGDLSELEELYLFWGGSNFVRLPTSIDRLSKLKILHLRWCLSLTSLPTSLGNYLTNLKELTLEGCSSLQDMSCLKDARYAWIHIQCLKIIACPSLNLTEMFMGQRKPNSPEFFPSLTHLCLRRNAMTGETLSNIWSFIQRCPHLMTLDVSDNHIDTLQYLAETCLLTAQRRRTQCSLRGLNLAGNPVVKGIRSVEMTTCDSIGTTTTIQNNSEHNYVLQIVRAHPQLDSLVTCCNHGERHTLTPMFTPDCLVASSLYSPQLRHALDLNHVSRGNASHLLREDATTNLPLSLWPLILERTMRSNISSWDTTVPWSRQCGVANGSQLKEREASVLFSLLQGPVFAARGNN